MKFGGQFGCVTKMNWLDFGEDPDPGGGMRATECPSSFLCFVCWEHVV